MIQIETLRWLRFLWIAWTENDLHERRSVRAGFTADHAHARCLRADVGRITIRERRRTRRMYRALESLESDSAAYSDEEFLLAEDEIYVRFGFPPMNPPPEDW